MTAPRSRSRQQPKQLNAGMFQAEISSFALRLAAEVSTAAAKRLASWRSRGEPGGGACSRSAGGRVSSVAGRAAGRL
jgi:hypothetical protein